jgi:hypothetical protein
MRGQPSSIPGRVAVGITALLMFGAADWPAIETDP